MHFLIICNTSYAQQLFVQNRSVWPDMLAWADAYIPDTWFVQKESSLSCRRLFGAVPVWHHYYPRNDTALVCLVHFCQATENKAIYYFELWSANFKSVMYASRGVACTGADFNEFTHKFVNNVFNCRPYLVKNTCAVLIAPLPLFFQVGLHTRLPPGQRRDKSVLGGFENIAPNKDVKITLRILRYRDMSHSWGFLFWA